MFKKQAELPPEPKLITEEQIQEDLLVSSNDPVYSDEVKYLLETNEIVDSGVRIGNESSKSFQTVDKIMRIKEDVLLQRKLLLEGVDNLHSLRVDLKQVEADMRDNSSQDT